MLSALSRLMRVARIFEESDDYLRGRPYAAWLLVTSYAMSKSFVRSENVFGPTGHPVSASGTTAFFSRRKAALCGPCMLEVKCTNE